MVCSSDNDCSGIFGYPPSPGWAKNFNGVNYWGISLDTASDGGYVIAGGKTDIAKLDASGNLSWTREVLTGDTGDDFWDVQKAADDGYIAIGQTNLGLGEMDFLLSKFSSTGALSWTKTIGGDGWEWGYSVAPASDGGYLAVGGTDTYGPGYDSWLIVKLDASGDLSWAKTIGSAGHEDALSAQQTSDGGYIIEGSLDKNVFPQKNLIVKLDASGNLSWAKEVATGGIPTSGIKQTSDGGYIASGGTASGEGLIYKLTSGGDLSWAKKIAGVYGGEARQTIDGGYVFGTYGATWNSLIIKFSPSGNLSWARSLGDIGSYPTLEQTADGGYVFAGPDGIVKLDFNGNLSGCSSVSPAFPSISDHALTIINSSLPFTSATPTVSDQTLSSQPSSLILNSVCPF
jgi:hypothetical protein